MIWLAALAVACLAIGGALAFIAAYFDGDL